ncbi:uncharacterized protein METZ01_LOCUS53151, partial [marine metagenome]|jgi:hypothetical protein|tara:strand:- start:4015 stop:4125 length:111 start_codon:yes stop_codon:yes gene_type:complete
VYSTDSVTSGNAPAVEWIVLTSVQEFCGDEVFEVDQ